MDIFDTFFLVEYLRQWAARFPFTFFIILIRKFSFIFTTLTFTFFFATLRFDENVSRGRIVILTMHPPTYEIFTMISKVVTLISGNRINVPKPGGFTFLRPTDVFWKAPRDVAILRIHRVR